MNKVYIVIINYNSYSDTIECIESLSNIEYSNYQIILVDNCSTDNSIECLKNWCNGDEYKLETSFPELMRPISEKPLDFVYLNEDNLETSNYNNRLIFVKAKQNKGFAAGNNIAINYIIKNNSNAYCWMLNNDTVVKKDALLNLVEYQKVNNLGLTGSVLKYYDNPNIIQAVGGKVNSFFGTTSHIVNLSCKEIDYVIGASCLVSPKVLREIGPLSEEYFLYYEDVDYSYRVTSAGHKIGFANRSLLYHKTGKSTGANIIAKKRNDDIDLLILRNKIKFYHKFMSGFFGLYAGFIIVIVLRILRGKFNMIKPIIKLLIDKKL